MRRLDKTGIEFVNGHQNVSAVVTRDFFDWSVLPRNDNPSSIWMRLQRFNDTVQISYSLDGEKWSMIRLAYFPEEVPVKIGMVTTAPGIRSYAALQSAIEKRSSTQKGFSLYRPSFSMSDKSPSHSSRPLRVGKSAC